eukprot:6190607-Pleurochrysis_carterae.AAC.2
MLDSLQPSWASICCVEGPRVSRLFVDGLLSTRPIGRHVCGTVLLFHRDLITGGRAGPAAVHSFFVCKDKLVAACAGVDSGHFKIAWPVSHAGRSRWHATSSPQRSTPKLRCCRNKHTRDLLLLVLGRTLNRLRDQCRVLPRGLLRFFEHAATSAISHLHLLNVCYARQREFAVRVPLRQFCQSGAETTKYIGDFTIW